MQPTVHANEGALATLRVYVQGDPRPDVRWQKGRRDVDTERSGRFRLIDGATLQVKRNRMMRICCTNLAYLLPEILCERTKCKCP